MLDAGSRDGRISICRVAENPRITSMRAPGETRSLSLHPSGFALAVSDAKTGDLIVLAIDGSKIYSTSAPSQANGTPNWVAHGYWDCWFDQDGSYLWCAAHLS